MRDERVGTGQHVLRALGAGKRISRNKSDVGVVTNDAGQRDGVEVSLLGAGEHSVPLPPKPQSTDTFKLLHCSFTLVSSRSADSLVVPVSISQGSELSGQQAGQKRTDSAFGQSWLRDGPHPQIDVVWCPVQKLEFVSQSDVTQDFTKLCCRVGNREATKSSPRAVS